MKEFDCHLPIQVTWLVAHVFAHYFSFVFLFKTVQVYYITTCQFPEDGHLIEVQLYLITITYRANQVLYEMFQFFFENSNCHCV